jgi:aryl-alcohol dehydrogenase-like predicted oxidoreductase
VGATRLAQLQTNIDSINVALDQDVLAGIQQIHLLHPNPSP